MKRWTEEELENIIDLSESKKSYTEIAEITGRTAKAIRLKLNKMGFIIDKSKIIEKVLCKNCENEFESEEKYNRKFCSRSCSISYNNIGIQRNIKNDFGNIECNNCHTEFYGNKNRKFCSNKCQGEYTKKITDAKIILGKISSRVTLRRYLFEKDGHICQMCKNTEWNDKPIPLVLDHINGDPYNDLPENLRLICPNCDAQTDFYKNKNKGRGRKDRMTRYYEGKSY